MTAKRTAGGIERERVRVARRREDPAVREAERAHRERPEVKARRKAYQDAWYAENREKRNAQQREYYRRNREAVNARLISKRFNIDREEWMRQQDYKCAICCIPFSDDVAPNVDHDHECCPPDTSCGRCVRGVLCGACNRGLGAFRDSPDLLAAAAFYVSRTRKERTQ